MNDRLVNAWANMGINSTITREQAEELAQNPTPKNIERIQRYYLNQVKPKEAPKKAVFADPNDEFLAGSPANLGIGNPNVNPHPVVIQAISDRLDDSQKYVAPLGSDNTRKVVAEYFNSVYGFSDSNIHPDYHEGEKPEGFTKDDAFVTRNSTNIFDIVLAEGKERFEKLKAEKIAELEKNIKSNPQSKKELENELKQWQKAKPIVASIGLIYNATKSNAERKGYVVKSFLGSSEEGNLPSKDELNAQYEVLTPFERECIVVLIPPTHNPNSLVTPDDKIKDYAEFVNKVDAEQNKTKFRLRTFLDLPYTLISALPETSMVKYLSEKVKSTLVIADSLSKKGGLPSDGAAGASKDEGFIQYVGAKILDSNLSVGNLADAAVGAFFAHLTNVYANVFENFRTKLVNKNIVKLWCSTGINKPDPNLLSQDQLVEAHQQLPTMETAEKYGLNQKYLGNLLSAVCKELGLDQKVIKTGHNIGMYVNFFLTELKDRELSDAKVLYDGLLSFKNVLGKDKIETGADLQKALEHCVGLENCGPITCRALEMFNGRAEDVGVRFCHTNPNQLNELGVKYIAKMLSAAYNLPEIPEEKFAELSTKAMKRAINYNDYSFRHYITSGRAT